MTVYRQTNETLHANTQPPRVSVVVAIYNVERYLEQCLLSLTAQDESVAQIICIDDGSTDRSGEILDRIAGRDNRFVVTHRKNGGYGSAMNEGIAQACGEYIGIVEPDDFVEPTMFRQLTQAAQKHERPDIVKTAYWRVCDAATDQEHELPAYYLGHMQHVDEPFTIEDDADLLLYHPSIWTAIYRRDWLEREQIRFKEVPGAGWVDNPFLMETMLAARSIVYLDEPLYHYREFTGALAGGLKDPQVIVDRWLEMDDVARHRHAGARVLEAHYSRGCSYIEMLQNDFDPHDPTVKAGIKRMASHIDGAVVRRSKKILPNYKRAYRKAVGWRGLFGR